MAYYTCQLCDEMNLSAGAIDAHERSHEQEEGGL
jgi:hypothetical protein